MRRRPQFFTKSFPPATAIRLGRAARNGIATPSSRRRVDGVEDDAMIQQLRVKFDFHTGASWVLRRQGFIGSTLCGTTRLVRGAQRRVRGKRRWSGRDEGKDVVFFSEPPHARCRPCLRAAPRALPLREREPRLRPGVPQRVGRHAAKCTEAQKAVLLPPYAPRLERPGAGGWGSEQSWPLNAMRRRRRTTSRCSGRIIFRGEGKRRVYRGAFF